MRQPSFQLLSQKQLNNFPSASAIDFYNNKLYVTGDDARYLAILDTNYNVTDTIVLFPGTELRIPKKEKADLEASAIVQFKNTDYLLVAGSSSQAERELIYLFPLNDLRKYEKLSTTTLSKALHQQGIKEINIEGATAVKNKLVFGNRANFNNRHNHLITVSSSFLDTPATVEPYITQLILEDEKDIVIGLSGLAYVEAADILLFTASIEHTANATEDGSIGNSYLGYISAFSSKLQQTSLKPDALINLSKTNKNFADHKIESVCVESANGELILHLVADNDDGTSTIFKIRMDPPW